MLAEEFHDHAQHPRNRKESVDLAFVGHAANPLCADVIDVGIATEQGVVTHAVFAGRGCAVCVGGASAVCAYVQGMRIDDVERLFAGGAMPHIAGIPIGRMREGCVTVSVIALQRALEEVNKTSV